MIFNLNSNKNYVDCALHTLNKGHRHLLVVNLFILKIPFILKNSFYCVVEMTVFRGGLLLIAIK